MSVYIPSPNKLVNFYNFHFYVPYFEFLEALARRGKDEEDSVTHPCLVRQDKKIRSSLSELCLCSKKEKVKNFKKKLKINKLKYLKIKRKTFLSAKKTG